MPTPVVGMGDSFEYATVASPTTFTTLAQVISITFSGDKVSTEKTTVMGGTTDTYISGTQEPGSVDVKCFFIPADTTQVGLDAIRVAGVPVAMKALYGTSNTSSFSGIVESFTIALLLDKPATLDVKIKITGAITRA
jgi:hypothetical protein